jgi:hypothetical protein
MEEEVVALYQNRQKEKELKEGNKKEGNRETDDETLLASLKGSPLGVGTLEEVCHSHPISGDNVLTCRLLMMIMPL